MNLKDTYNRIAKDWHQDHKQDDWWVEEVETFISFLSAGDLILDVGCGGGSKSKYLSDRGFHVTGIDFSEKMIEIARRETPETSFEVLDFAAIGSAALPMFDGIFMEAALLHVRRDEAQETIKNVAQKLKAKGYFYISVKEKKSSREDEEVKVEDRYGYPFERFFSYYTADEIKACFMNLEFLIVSEKITKSGNTSWIQIIAQKV